MISFFVRLRFKPEDRETIAGILRELAVVSRLEPGCVNYVAHTVQGVPDTVLIYEQYRDEAAREAHRASPHFAKLASGGLYQHMLERAVEDLDALI